MREQGVTHVIGASVHIYIFCRWNKVTTSNYITIVITMGFFLQNHEFVNDHMKQSMKQIREFNYSI